MGVPESQASMTKLGTNFRQGEVKMRRILVLTIILSVVIWGCKKTQTFKDIGVALADKPEFLVFSDDQRGYFALTFDKEKIFISTHKNDQRISLITVEQPDHAQFVEKLLFFIGLMEGESNKGDLASILITVSALSNPYTGNPEWLSKLSEVCAEISESEIERLSNLLEENNKKGTSF